MYVSEIASIVVGWLLLVRYQRIADPRCPTAASLPTHRALTEVPPGRLQAGRSTAMRPGCRLARERPEAVAPAAPADGDATRVVVTVCSYRRNELLDKLLTAIRRNVDHVPTDVLVGVVVVNHNPHGAARSVCECHQGEFPEV